MIRIYKEKNIKYSGVADCSINGDSGDRKVDWVRLSNLNEYIDFSVLFLRTIRGQV